MNDQTDPQSKRIIQYLYLGLLNVSQCSFNYISQLYGLIGHSFLITGKQSSSLIFRAEPCYLLKYTKSIFEYYSVTTIQTHTSYILKKNKVFCTIWTTRLKVGTGPLKFLTFTTLKRRWDFYSRINRENKLKIGENLHK